MEKVIGILEVKGDGWVVIGECCACPTEQAVLIYDTNILPYNQHCCNCGKALVEGNPLFPELYDGVILGDKRLTRDYFGSSGIKTLGD